MKIKYALIGVLCIALSACASVKNPANLNQLYGIEASYGLALSAAVAYRSLPLCKKNENATVYNICAERDVILKLQAADKKAQIAIDQANAFVKEYPMINAAEAIAVAAKAVSAFKALEEENHIY